MRNRTYREKFVCDQKIFIQKGCGVITGAEILKHKYTNESRSKIIYTNTKRMDCKNALVFIWALINGSRSLVLQTASPRLASLVYLVCLELSRPLGVLGGELFVGFSLPSVEVEVLLLVAVEPVRPVAMYMLVQGGG